MKDPTNPVKIPHVSVYPIVSSFSFTPIIHFANSLEAITMALITGIVDNGGTIPL